MIHYQHLGRSLQNFRLAALAVLKSLLSYSTHLAHSTATPEASAFAFVVAFCLCLLVVIPEGNLLLP